MPTPFQSFKSLARVIPRAMVLFTLVSFAPLPSALWLGNAGEPLFTPMAPFILLIASGLVITSWIVLLVILIPYGKLVSLVSRYVFCNDYSVQPLTASVDKKKIPQRNSLYRTVAGYSQSYL